VYFTNRIKREEYDSEDMMSLETSCISEARE